MLTFYHRCTEPVFRVRGASDGWGPLFGRTMDEPAPDWEALGDVPEGSAMFCSLIITSSLCGRPGRLTRSRPRTFGATRIVTGARGCWE